VLSDDPQLRYWNDEFAAASAIFRLRGEDLVGEVSRQQQHRVGLPLAP
jgi:hypothetical protein